MCATMLAAISDSDPISISFSANDSVGFPAAFVKSFAILPTAPTSALADWGTSDLAMLIVKFMANSYGFFRMAIISGTAFNPVVAWSMASQVARLASLAWIWDANTLVWAFSSASSCAR